MGLHRDFTPPPGDRDRATSVEERRSRTPGHLADGTLACPTCDLPTAPTATVMRPAQPLCCPYCGTSGAVRDFLTLGTPSRPARVAVTVRIPAAALPQLAAGRRGAR